MRVHPNPLPRQAPDSLACRPPATRNLLGVLLNNLPMVKELGCFANAYFGAGLPIRAVCFAKYSPNMSECVVLCNACSQNGVNYARLDRK